MEDYGERFRTPEGKGPHYISYNSEHPFPENPTFRSEPVLSESFRELIWRRAVEAGESLKVISAELNVDVRRVAAVVRLKEVEKRMEEEVSHFWFLRLPHIPLPLSRDLLDQRQNHTHPFLPPSPSPGSYDDYPKFD